MLVSCPCDRVTLMAARLMPVTCAASDSGSERIARNSHDLTPLCVVPCVCAVNVPASLEKNKQILDEKQWNAAMMLLRCGQVGTPSC